MPRRNHAPLASVVGTLLLLVGCAGPPPAPAGAPDPSTAAPGRLVTLPSGRDVYLECVGDGGPTVLFLSGGGLAADEWSTLPPGSAELPVMTDLARTHRVCAYDRPGTTRATGEPSRSDPVALPRTLTEMADEVDEVLTAAGESGPFLVVAHSFGSVIGRLYVGEHAQDVVGVVWVDGGHEAFYRDFERLVGPPGYDVPGVEYSLPATLEEMDRRFAEYPLPALPAVVVEHSRDRDRFPNPMGWDPSWPIGDLEEAWGSGQDALAALSPDTTRIVAEDSGHLIMVEQPGLLSAAIGQLSERIG